MEPENLFPNRRQTDRFHLPCVINLKECNRSRMFLPLCRMPTHNRISQKPHGRGAFCRLCWNPMTGQCQLRMTIYSRLASGQCLLRSHTPNKAIQYVALHRRLRLCRLVCQLAYYSGQVTKKKKILHSALCHQMPSLSHEKGIRIILPTRELLSYLHVLLLHVVGIIIGI